MDEQTLETLWNDLESDRVERKASVSDDKKIRETICALANDLPHHRQSGVIFVGVNDKGGCAQTAIDDKLLKTLAAMGTDGNILPLPSIVVQKKTIKGCEVAVVIVHPADAPPVRYRGRVYVRVGPTTRVASAQDERRLTEKRRANDLPFDLHPVTWASLADLDLALFERVYLPAAFSPDILEENERSLEEQLASLRFVTAGELIPTTLGILVAGKDPRYFFPGAYIQFLRLDGLDLADPIKDSKEIDGPLPDLLRRLDDLLTVNISVASDITTQSVEIRRPDYPLVALQQLARNAVLHRTYEGTNAPIRLTWFSDRIEIISPGGPFGQVSRQNFGQPGVADYRNPHLAEAMKNLGYVQRFGVGIHLARQQLEKNGNPPLEFMVEGNYIFATIRR
jgi:ATP-dependent DNA helicase RecG